MIKLLASLLLFISSPALAAAIQVQSGEHGAFTRLVVYVPKANTWSLLNQTREAKLKVSNWSDGFDLRNAFRKIGTERIRSLAATPSELVITLGCDCSVISNTLAGGFVQLDVVEAAYPKPLPRPRSNDPEIVEAEPAEVEFVQLWDIPDSEPSFSVLDELANESVKNSVDAFEQSLVEELSKSATVNRLETGDQATQNPRAISNFRTQKELLAILEDRARFSDSADVFPSDRSKKEEQVCSNQSLFSVSQWGNGTGFSEQLSSIRRSLISEQTEVSTKAKRSLVKFYLHYGLAPEAISVLQSSEKSEANAQLAKLARSMESEFFQGSGELDSHLYCDGETGFWSVLSSSLDAKISEAKVKDVLSVFQGLPPYLQEISAERLIRVLEANNALIAVEVVKNTVARGKSAESEDDVGSQDIDIEGSTARQLREIIAKNGDDGPLAMSLLLEKTFQTKSSITLEELELADAYAFQMQGTDLEKRLTAARIISNFANGYFDKASELFFEFEASSNEQGNKVLNVSVNEMIDAGEIARASEFVWRVLQSSNYKEFESDTLDKLRSELIKIGQPQLLRQLISSFEMEQISSLQAIKIAQQLDDAVSVAEVISGVKEQENRNTILSLLTRYDPSIAWNFRDELPKEAASDVAWSLGSWEAVGGESNRSQLAKRLSSENKTIDPQDKPIGTARNILEDSETDRSDIAGLLAEIDIRTEAAEIN